jgi:rare lipoprotein A
MITARTTSVLCSSLAIGMCVVFASTPLLAQAPAASAAPATETGLAAVYSNALHGRRTASGQTYDRRKLTAAHKTLPFGTVVRVTNVKNNKTVDLRINDRGPKQVERVLDISPAAASALGFSRLVMREVAVEVLELGDGRRSRR